MSMKSDTHTGVQADPGWYSDPQHRPDLRRYWDGSQWTELYDAAPSPTTHEGNGLAVASLCTGIGASLLGLIPILAIPALICGGLAVAFGAIGWRRVRRDPIRGGKGLAIAGICLGTLGIVLGVAGYIIVSNAFNDLGNNTNNG